MKAKVNGINEFEFTEAELKESVITIDDKTILLRKDGINHRARLISFDKQSKRYMIEIGKKIYEVKLENELDQLIATMGLQGKRSLQVTDIKSPMPGLVLKVLKQNSDEVKAGETILVLEAMKMENAIKSPIDCTIKSIDVEEGQSVDKGMVLIRFA